MDIVNKDMQHLGYGVRRRSSAIDTRTNGSLVRFVESGNNWGNNWGIDLEKNYNLAYQLIDFVK